MASHLRVPPTILSVFALTTLCSSSAVMGDWATRIEFIGEARLQPGIRIDQTVAGGLSGLTYDTVRDRYYAVSDDPGRLGPARFYTLEIDLGDGRLDDGDLRIERVTFVRGVDGQNLPADSVDPEGIAMVGEDALYLSSEGQIRHQIPPFVWQIGFDGSRVREFDLPDRYAREFGPDKGVRHNLGFESLTLTPDGHYLFTATENALVQDGPEAGTDVRSPSRLLKFEVESGQLLAEFVYWTERVAAPSPVPDGLQVAGLVELLALDSDSLLALERSFSFGVGNSVRLFEVSLQGATDVSRYPSLKEVPLDELRAVRKDLVLDLESLGLYLDNLEGMTFGPQLADGRRTLILVADDNFNTSRQVTQVFAFAVSDEPVDLEVIQGAGHRSPYEGQWVRGVTGVVTAVAADEGSEFWLQEPGPDSGPATSDAVFVVAEEASARVEVGDLVRLSARVAELGRPDELTSTTLQASTLEVLSPHQPLPVAEKLGKGGRSVPSEVVDDDGLSGFDPHFDGVDFWESLEGMRVVVRDALVVGPTNTFGEVTIVADGGAGATGRSSSHGLVTRPGDDNPERLAVDFGRISAAVEADVGDRFDGDLEGILVYRFGHYRLQLTQEAPSLISGGREPERTALSPGRRRLTVATLNVDNLSAASESRQLTKLARTLVWNLRGPDIVALQEIQDDDGPKDSGCVTAARTLTKLTEAVRRADGPRYDFRQIDPEDNQDGGRPGANIRVAFLFNSQRVRFVDRGRSGSSEAVGILTHGEGFGLSLSPGRIAPRTAAFNGDESRGFQPSRKSLVGEFRFAGRRLLVINNHWSSKRSDSPLFGAVQPQRRASEDQRSQQARQIADFVEGLLVADPEASVIVLGDLNDFEFRSPLRVLTGRSLENLIERVPIEHRYTFNYRGSAGALDHILVSRGLLEQALARVDIVHVNSDFAATRRASDHDPVIAQFDFAASP